MREEPKVQDGKDTNGISEKHLDNPSTEKQETDTETMGRQSEKEGSIPKNPLGLLTLERHSATRGGNLLSHATIELFAIPTDPTV